MVVVVVRGRGSFFWYNGEAPGRGIMMEMEDSRMVNGWTWTVYGTETLACGGVLAKRGRSVRGTPVHLVGERANGLVSEMMRRRTEASK